MLNLTEYHSKFPGSVRWKLTPQGLLVENQGPFVVPPDIQIRANYYLARYASLFGRVSKQLQVPLELLAACALTEGAPKHPEMSVRMEPGYISDEQTPSRISAGFCQLLISTARAVMHNPAINRAWLLDPTNSLVACASYMLQQKPVTGFDPVYAACAYNAGGLYVDTNPGNRWFNPGKSRWLCRAFH